MTVEQPKATEQEPQRTPFQALRHGRTAWNIEKKIQGNVDLEILPDLIEGYLRDIGAENLERPDAFVVSALIRTEQTALAIARYRNWDENIPIIKDARLNERKWGVFEGVNDEEAHKRVIEDSSLREGFPQIQSLSDVYEAWDTYYKAPGGESIPEVAARVKPALREIAEQYAGKKLLFVSHAGVLISLGLNHAVISTGELVLTPKDLTLRVS